MAQLSTGTPHTIPCAPTQALGAPWGTQESTKEKLSRQISKNVRHGFSAHPPIAAWIRNQHPSEDWPAGSMRKRASRNRDFLHWAEFSEQGTFPRSGGQAAKHAEQFVSGCRPGRASRRIWWQRCELTSRWYVLSCLPSYHKLTKQSSEFSPWTK